MEYDVIKTLREIQLLKRLNDLSENLYKQHSMNQTRNGRGLFMTELIDIITPPVFTTGLKNCPGSGPSSGGDHSQNTYASSDIEKQFKNADLKEKK